MGAKRATAVGTAERSEDTLLITVDQAARRIGISTSVLYPYVMTGRLASVVIGGRTRRVIAARIPDFIESLWDEQRYTLAG